eukprot:Skav233223  [mRNA]  locus=scaffold1215:98534:109400:+ [translate_table: standard]
MHPCRCCRRHRWQLLPEGREAAGWHLVRLLEAKALPKELAWAAREVHEKGFVPGLAAGGAMDVEVILKDLLTREEAMEIREAIQPLLQECGALAADAGQMRGRLPSISGGPPQRGRNNFEGYNTKRVYSVVGKTRALDTMIAHPTVMALLHEFLLPNFLLTAAQVIDIHPGETPQPFHFDDQFCRMPRPRPAFSMATVWALDDNFKAENGATVIIPGSHTWDDNCPQPQVMKEMAIPAELPIGSCVFFSGTLW